MTSDGNYSGLTVGKFAHYLALNVVMAQHLITIHNNMLNIENYLTSPNQQLCNVRNVFLQLNFSYAVIHEWAFKLKFCDAQIKSVIALSGSLYIYIYIYILILWRDDMAQEIVIVKASYSILIIFNAVILFGVCKTCMLINLQRVPDRKRGVNNQM